MSPAAIFQHARDTVMQDPAKLLGMTIGPHTLNASGMQVPKAAAQNPPTLYSTSLNTGTYVAIALDLDAPYKSMNMLSPILHWIQAGLVPQLLQNGSFKLVADADAAGTHLICNWLEPAPPPGADPHRYLVLLYEQPFGFDAARLAGKLQGKGGEVGMGKRVRWDLGAFEKDAGLGSVIAASYFLCN